MLVFASVILVAGCTEKPSSTTQDSVSSTADPKWAQCQSDNDCVVSFGSCGEWVAVNQAFVKEQQGWARRTGAALSCPENKSPKPTAICRNQVCTTSP